MKKTTSMVHPKRRVFPSPWLLERPAQVRWSQQLAVAGLRSHFGSSLNWSLLRSGLGPHVYIAILAQVSSRPASL